MLRWLGTDHTESYGPRAILVGEITYGHTSYAGQLHHTMCVMEWKFVKMNIYTHLVKCRLTEDTGIRESLETTRLGVAKEV